MRARYILLLSFIFCYILLSCFYLFLSFFCCFSLLACKTLNSFSDKKKFSGGFWFLVLAFFFWSVFFRRSLVLVGFLFW